MQLLLFLMRSIRSKGLTWRSDVITFRSRDAHRKILEIHQKVFGNILVENIPGKFYDKRHRFEETQASFLEVIASPSTYLLVRFPPWSKMSFSLQSKAEQRDKWSFGGRRRRQMLGNLKISDLTINKFSSSNQEKSKRTAEDCQNLRSQHEQLFEENPF